MSWFLGVTGLGAVAAAVTVPHFGIWLAVAIIVLALLVFGAFFLYRRLRARRQSRNFEGAVSAQTAASPRSISDPNRRAALDKLRQKFQTGLQEFKSRGKDIYKLPWYVIIGEPGSGKSEAIRHSGIDFPPGLQDELQGSGGTVNMDWWFTNRSIILDTAGSMIFNEAQETPEWREFLRLLKKARPYCPVNGLFLVLSVESLIKDSADTIAQKASRLAQQLDMIQRTLDVRFPVYLLVTKCDLLAGFREFFDNIEDPSLQHQIFGWSNPDPLDAHFRPDLVEEHLKVVAERLGRRRLALLRDGGTPGRYGETQFFTTRSGAPKRRLDEVDSMYALPESVLRLAPRLRRYLETIFVAGEWSAKPVFLRGIYFTSSMREGKALDEAMALATGVALDQLPEDRPWEKNRSFFMRDLFLEKVFREYGLVTRATNTLTLLRKRRLLIFGVATVALLLLLFFSFTSFRSLNRNVLKELNYWNAGATNWNNGQWSPSLVRVDGADIYHFAYAGDDPVPGTGLSVVQYQQRLMEITQKRLSVGWIFKPIAWLSSGKDMNRPEAQRLLFEGGVLKPLVLQTRAKMEHQDSLPGDTLSMTLHREALLSLIRLEADNLAAGGGSLAGTNAADAAGRYLRSFTSYLTGTNVPADTNLVEILRYTYAGRTGAAKWPPAALLGGNTLAANHAVSNGLAVFRRANQSAQTEITREVGMVDELADSLRQYEQVEADWQASKAEPCNALGSGGPLLAAKQKVDAAWASVLAATNIVGNSSLGLADHYALLEKAAKDQSANVFQGIANDIPDSSKTVGLFADINQEMNRFAKESAGTVRRSLDQRTNWLAAMDQDQTALMPGGLTAHEARWKLYLSACALAGETVAMDNSVVGTEWKKLNELRSRSDAFQAQLAAYKGPLAAPLAEICRHIAGDADVKIKGQMVDDYARLAANLIQANFDFSSWSTDAGALLLERVGRDLKAASDKFSPEDLVRLQPVSRSLLDGAAKLRQKIGFPIMLNASADEAMSLANLAALRSQLEALQTVLNDPTWSGLLDDASRLRAHSLAQNLKLYGDVAAALVNPNGKPATAECFFVPPKEGPDDAIIRDYRRADVKLGEEDSKWQEVAKYIGDEPVSLVKSTVDASLKVSVQTLEGQAVRKIEEQPAWALVRLIRDGRMQRSDDGKSWTLRNKVKDPDQPIEGAIVFKLVTERPLPKPEDWPQE